MSLRTDASAVISAPSAPPYPTNTAYMREKEEKEKQKMELTRKRDEKRAIERKKLNKERALLGLKPIEEMTDAETRGANKAKVKKMWGDIFSSVMPGWGNEEE